jgi:hypothetical protein
MEYEPKQILKIRKAARSGWIQVFADVICSEHFAEAVTKVESPGESEVHANV